ncbi:hypothetical protein [Nocardioides pantholopis]|uniref:hypothetical protein n=1 Tax=Nocardioides pantholopis TaxID=2483798 RepID=UPI000F093DD3|nr:hypothetical protein [Nocardioides pantholopis]
MAFRYELQRVQGMGNFARFECPKCGRKGLLQFDHEFAKENAKLVHGYGSCPDETTFLARREQHGSPVSSERQADDSQ